MDIYSQFTLLDEVFLGFITQDFPLWDLSTALVNNLKYKLVE